MSETVYELVGGRAFFDALVADFYARVEHDAVLRPLYPADLGDARDALAAFLVQYFGGPADYSAAKGHPRLRMRHVHIRIGIAERDAWYGAMAAALDTTIGAVAASGAVASSVPSEASSAVSGEVFDPAVRSAMLEYFARSADWMINTDPEPDDPTT